MATDGFLTRRHFVGLCAGLGLLPVTGLSAASGQPAFLSAFRDRNGSYGVAALDDTGTVLFTEALPGRGHDTVASPDRRTAVTFARRPGRFALVFDVHRTEPSFAFEASQGRHFFGHGFFSPDGRLLYATENDYDGEQGVLGIYDVEAGYRRLGEFATQGIGPHEALLLRDGRTVAIANGGILTHPDYPRQKLNLPSMSPSLAYLDLQTGDVQDEVRLPAHLHQLSIRHMTQAGDGSIWFGGQYEGAATDEVQLVGRHDRGQPIELVTMPTDLVRDLSHYVGSVKASQDGSSVVITSPRGGVAYTFDTGTRVVSAQHRLADICGAAALGNGFGFSSGGGILEMGTTQQSAYAWDNHLRSVLP